MKDFFDLISFQFVPGPLFLVLYGALIVLGVQIARMRMLSFQLEPHDGTHQLEDLTCYQLAFLIGQQRRALLAAVARLEASGVIKVSPEGKIENLQHASSPDPLEEAIVRQARSPISFTELAACTSIESALERLDAELQEAGLLLSQDRRKQAQDFSRLTIFALLVLGGTRLVIGAMNGRPVKFLIWEMIILIALWSLAVVAPTRSRAGQQLVELAPFEYAALESASYSMSSKLDSSDKALAMAVFGKGALAALLIPAAAAATAGGCGSSCGGGCGGGCGGCGG